MEVNEGEETAPRTESGEGDQSIQESDDQNSTVMEGGGVSENNSSGLGK